MTSMKVIDNVQTIVRDDLIETVTKGSRLSIAAACFSIYAYQELRKQLEGIEELRFIFTSDAFTTEHAPKEKREFYIPRLNRERSLYGSEYELKLRNELSQKAIAKECAAWICRKVQFRSNVSGENMNSFKAIQDYVYTDGTAEQSVERRFVEALDSAQEVFIYAKLPKGFSIPTPVGHYSPDWAIVFHEGVVKHVYFIAETKGTMESLNLRPIEKAKIDCAKKLFNTLSTGLVTYDHVDSFQELMNKVMA